MEHILISPGKLKLMLTKNDLAKYELDCETIDSEDPTTRRSFKELLSDVKEISGFDASDDKLFIQLYPSRDGGAEIYITKLSQNKDAPVADDSHICITNIYRFDKMSDLLAACQRVNSLSVPHPRKSTAWEGDGVLYLITDEDFSYRDYLKKKSSRLCDVISECGTSLGSAPIIASYVREHCSCFCYDNAITTLSAFA